MDADESVSGRFEDLRCGIRERSNERLLPEESTDLGAGPGQRSSVRGRLCDARIKENGQEGLSGHIHL